MMAIGARRVGSRKLLVAVAVAYAYRLAAAWLLALPLLHVVRASNIPQFPEGDRLLFEGGGWYLLEVVQQHHRVLLASLASTFWLLLALAFAALIPKWLLLRALCRGAEASASSAAQSLPRLALLGALSWLTRLLLLVAALALAATLRSYFSSARDERVADLVFVAALAVGSLPQLALSVWHDLARIAVVRRGLGAANALGAALGPLRRRALRLLGRYGALELLALALVACGAVVVDALDVARSGAWRSLAAISAHQLVVLGGILIEACWLYCAARADADARA